MLDKRDIGELFRERLIEVVERYPGNRSAFAASIGLDRSALSQLLSGRTVRLPRAETLAAIADQHQVSLDWLLGLSQRESVAPVVAATLEVEERAGGATDTRLMSWRRDAAGYKIRYVPASLPDSLRTDAVIEYELGARLGPSQETRKREADLHLEYSRRPETDMEVCMQLQRLRGFARGDGVWAGLDRRVRAEQIAHMADILAELYPTFRLFLYDGLRVFSAPYTVFGPLRAAIYIGDAYVVINGTEQIRALADHFDGLIRRATVNPHEAAEWVRGLAREVV